MVLRRSVSVRMLVLLLWLGAILGSLLAVPQVDAQDPLVAAPFLVSLADNQSIRRTAFADEDVLIVDGKSLSLFFDGSDVGLGRADLVGLALIDSDSLLLTFNTTVTVDGIVAQPQDIVRFDASYLGATTGGSFSVLLRGSDVGLTTKGESLDAVAVLPDGRILISTAGNVSVPGVSGTDEDVLAFTAANLGDDTSGTWSLYFDGSDARLANGTPEDVDALDVDQEGAIYLSTVGKFHVMGMKGGDEDVFVCVPQSTGESTACAYSPELYLDGSQLGIASNDVDAFHSFAVPLTPTPTPTNVVTPRPTITHIPGSISLPANIDHETGDFRQYAAIDTDFNDLAIALEAGLAGTAYGLSAQVDDNHRAFASAALETPSTTGLVRARFYFDPNGLLMEHLSQVSLLFLIRSGEVDSFASMKLIRINGRYCLRGVMVDDNGVHRETELWTISDEPHYVEIQVRRASSPTSNDGTYEAWIDGVPKKTMIGVDSFEKFQSFQYVSVGLNSMAGTVWGTYFLDEIVVNDDGREIGPVVNIAPAATPSSTAASTPTQPPIQTP